MAAHGLTHKVNHMCTVGIDISGTASEPLKYIKSSLFHFLGNLSLPVLAVVAESVGKAENMADSAETGKPVAYFGTIYKSEANGHIKRQSFGADSLICRGVKKFRVAVIS